MSFKNEHLLAIVAEVNDMANGKLEECSFCRIIISMDVSPVNINIYLHRTIKDPNSETSQRVSLCNKYILKDIGKEILSLSPQHSEIHNIDHWDDPTDVE